jgi:hypothetical protein
VNDNIVRNGVAVRGKIDTVMPCINGGHPNNNVLLTSEDDCVFASHALVVRDPDSLAQLYRKPLVHDGTGYQAWGAAPPVFSFSTNDEGLFFQHCYTVPTLTSTPSPYPGAEFGAPNTRKIAVVSVDPLTFEPTITELITLEDNEWTVGSRFAVAMTLP